MILNVSLLDKFINPFSLGCSQLLLCFKYQTVPVAIKGGSHLEVIFVLMHNQLFAGCP